MHQSFQGLLNDPLTFGFHRGRSFIQYEDSWICQKSAGNRDPLALPSRKLDATLSDMRFITAWERLNKLVSIRHVSGFPGFLLGCIGPGKADVLAHGSIKQNCFLQYKSHLTAQ